MPTTADHTLFTATVEERRRLVTALEALSPTDWNQATLCEGWRVREVAAHLSMAYRYSRWGVVRGVLGAGGNFPRFADTAARHDVSMMADHELLQSLADNVESPWRPPGGGPAGALSHDVIHGLDITEPLGLEAPSVATIPRPSLGSSLQVAPYGDHARALSGPGLLACHDHDVLQA